MSRNKDNISWKYRFSQILKIVFSFYDFSYDDFANAYGWSSSTIRYWSLGRNFPSQKALLDLKKYLVSTFPDDPTRNQQLHEEIKSYFNEDDSLKIYLSVKNLYPLASQFVGEILYACYVSSKHIPFPLPPTIHEVAPTNKTQIVVFDFDGTLTSGRIDKTTWETLWVKLGYDVGLCKQFHQKYNIKEISHKQWCDITEDYFRKRRLNKSTICEIASHIDLIHGVAETFHELAEKNIKIFIVSGSIKTIISLVLNDLCQYVEQICANEFLFDNNGYLIKIIGTNYDFEGKANFINEIATKYQFAKSDILFVGNSINDRFAYTSGCRTLCVNPRLTDPSNCKVWNYCIPFCEDLTDILEFI